MATWGGSVLEPGWLLSPAGRPYLDSIFPKNQRRVFGEAHTLPSPTPPPPPKWGCQHPKKTSTPPPGLLERPALPPNLAVPTVTYKLFVSGKSGVGKTALVATLAGTPVPPIHHETLGTWRGTGDTRAQHPRCHLGVTIPVGVVSPPPQA